MCTFGVREPKRAHLSAPVFKNTTKIQREDTQRGKKRTNFAAGQGKKKSEILGGPGEGCPGKGGPGKGGPGKGTEHDTNTQTHTQTHTNTHKHTKKQVEVGLAKVGFGQSRFWPKSAIGHDREEGPRTTREFGDHRTLKSRRRLRRNARTSVHQKLPNAGAGCEVTACTREVSYGSPSKGCTEPVLQSNAVHLED